MTSMDTENEKIVYQRPESLTDVVRITARAARTEPVTGWWLK
jgi:hypothetical protein